ncbi:hypothetical protein D1007_10920 [Hordeum vulgare]|nr:hypothetical protein D1007_10920 [Hordeum vulgare]
MQRARRPVGLGAALAAIAAERFIGRSLGITPDGKDVTEATLNDFTAKFKEQLAPEIIVAMRDFFHLDNKVVNDVEDALIDHGGDGALDMAPAQGGAAMQELVCVEETKLDNIDRFVAAFLGGNGLRNFAQRPTIGTRDGFLLLWDDDVLEVSHIAILTYYLSTMVRSHDSGVCFRLTNVHGPNDPTCKDAFFAELCANKPLPVVAWLALGDFNQISQARDKNKRSVNHRRINQFCSTLLACELKEIHL